MYIGVHVKLTEVYRRRCYKLVILFTFNDIIFMYRSRPDFSVHTLKAIHIQPSFVARRNNIRWLHTTATCCEDVY